MSNRISFFSLFFISLIFTACAEADLTTTVSVPQSYENATATSLTEQPNGNYELNSYEDLTIATSNDLIQIDGNGNYLKLTVAGGGSNEVIFLQETEITGLDINSDQNDLTLKSDIELTTRLVIAGSSNSVLFEFDSAIKVGGNYNRPARFALTGDNNQITLADGAQYENNITFEISGSGNYICAPIEVLDAWQIADANRKLYNQGNCNTP